MTLKPFISPPLIAYIPDWNPCVMSWAMTSGAGFRGTVGPGRQPSCVQRSVSPRETPSAPGYAPK